MLARIFVLLLIAQGSILAQNSPGASGLPGCGSENRPARLAVPGGTIEITFADGDLDLPREQIYKWVRNAAIAVATYYGRFPVSKESLRIAPAPGRDGVSDGWTIGREDGGFTRIRVGEHTTLDQLRDDWMLTHEFVHLAFPDMPRQHHWIEEGMATYVEPIARVQAGQLDVARMFRDVIRDMPKGQPQDGDEGLDHTHTWGRTYWGGALFCLEADVEIRRATKNKKGLQDAFRAILVQGGNIDQADWSLEKTLRVGDEATGTTVLEDLYARMGAKPMTVDLANLWKELGISTNGDLVEIDKHQDKAATRIAILAKRPVETRIDATVEDCTVK